MSKDNGGKANTKSMRQWYKAHAPAVPSWFMEDTRKQAEAAGMDKTERILMRWPSYYADAMIVEDRENEFKEIIYD